MKSGRWSWSMGVKFALLGILFVAVMGLVVQLLWNWLVPVLFAGPLISFWQALGLLLLSKILFGGFSKHHGRHGQGKWQPYWKAKWEAMSPEEREQLRQKMKEKCSWGQSPKPGSDTDQPS